MKGEEDEIATLLKKIEQQDELIDKLRTQENKLSSYIKEFKETMEKKINRDQEGTPKSVAEEQKIEKQMQKELQNAKLMYKNYQNELRALQKKSNKNNFTADNLLEMEQQIKKKEAYIRELNDDIKTLNIVKRKQEKMIEKKQRNEDGSKLSKIVEEIRKQKEILDSLKVKHQQKEEALQKRKLAIEQMENQYLEKCKKYGQKPITFEEFKEKRVQKRREQSVNKVGEFRKQVKKPITVKQIINSHLSIDDVEISEKGLNDLQQKKIVAENSLKIAKKKHERQIEELEERIQQLKQENESLNTKYLEKKKEKELIETAKTVNFKRNSSKTMKKLDPIK